ncbi:hypothetical protein SDC9_195818 [bioreactor metagenome]|uniref:Uncharacterized protein n=1 Tax=bioreactor metagenome TaxID=1076179 RepID=A0A645ILL0_9ZZZZ
MAERCFQSLVLADAEAVKRDGEVVNANEWHVVSWSLWRTCRSSSHHRQPAEQQHLHRIKHERKAHRTQRYSPDDHRRERHHQDADRG